ncbi:transposase [Roseibium sp. RKSG952]
MACLHKTRPEKSPVWAHVRRKFVDVHASSGSSIAAQAIQRIGKTL